ncbi:MAG: hypothetical protein RR442_07090, partial [Muribaculaceae bacterium]
STTDTQLTTHPIEATERRRRSVSRACDFSHTFHRCLLLSVDGVERLRRSLLGIGRYPTIAFAVFTTLWG